MKRITINAKGEVQRVGYRDIVEKIARKLRLTGYVENLKLYDVKIVAEGDESSLNEFLTRIRIDKHPVSPISVEDLDIEFGTATSEFKYFEIRRGDWTEELDRVYGRDSSVALSVCGTWNRICGNREGDAWQARPNDRQAGSDAR